MRFSCTKSHVFAQHGIMSGGHGPEPNVKMTAVRHRSRATFSRQPRQVRKEATVTGSFVCSEVPVPGFIFRLPLLVHFSPSNVQLQMKHREAKMFRSLILSAAIFLAVCSAAQTGPVPSILDMSEFVHDWQISKQFTIDVANAMPPEYYSFKPNPEEMTFGEQMVHIAGANVFRFNQITGVEPPFTIDPAKPPAADKQSALKLVEQSFDYVINVLPKITP